MRGKYYRATGADIVLEIIVASTERTNFSTVLKTEKEKRSKLVLFVLTVTWLITEPGFSQYKFMEFVFSKWSVYSLLCYATHNMHL
jgi:hypothetical protein